MDTHSVLVIITFRSECICFRVDSNYNLLKFKDEIYKKWSSLRHLDYELWYSFDGNHVLIDIDTSVQSLACFCFFKKIGKVDVDISLFRSVGCGSSNLSCSVSSSSGLSVDVCGSSDILSVASTSLGLTVVGSSHEVRKSLTWGLAITGIGQRFSSKKDFLDALLRYSIEKEFKHTKIKNDTTRFTACCSLKQSDGCKWYIRASAIQGI
ncbi:hypothetical protein FRX31_015743 [Thalictrum thalictroides]|uniref:Transposase MuDR plant domain-containing protein n=1 Tax=Thalictrum thalictroides TaxID=46969 RepID=A0A7J6WDI5_THATH|nr:hypothetical protein FRX31_015743 [Thalictrum thalictroides]